MNLESSHGPGQPGLAGHLVVGLADLLPLADGGVVAHLPQTFITDPHAFIKHLKGGKDDFCLDACFSASNYDDLWRVGDVAALLKACVTLPLLWYV